MNIALYAMLNFQLETKYRVSIQYLEIAKNLGQISWSLSPGSKN